MESGAKGAEVTVSGKIRGARAKAMKFKVGLTHNEVAEDEKGMTM